MSDFDLSASIRKGSGSRFTRWMILLILLALLGVGAWYGWQYFRGAEEGPTFVTEVAKEDRISLFVNTTGSLEPTNLITVGSELSGIVREIYVDTNDEVKKGQKLLLLDTTKLEEETNQARAAKQVAEARVSQAEATVQETEASLNRQEELLKISGGRTPSKATMDTTRAKVARAKADLESTKADVVAASARVRAFEVDLGKSYITSPVDGVILFRSIDIGQTVAASFTAPTLFLIGEDLKEMDLVANISEADIARVKVGQTASFTVDSWPGRKYVATVKKANFGSDNIATSSSSSNNSAASTGVVTYSVEFAVKNEDLSLRPGMTAVIEITIEQKDKILTVPNSALRFNPEYALSLGKPVASGNTTLVDSLSPGASWRRKAVPKPGASNEAPRVWTLRNGEPVEIPVTVGITDGRITEITSGDLTAGTEIITGLQPKPTP